MSSSPEKEAALAILMLKKTPLSTRTETLVGLREKTLRRYKMSEENRAKRLQVYRMRCAIMAKARAARYK